MKRGPRDFCLAQMEKALCGRLRNFYQQRHLERLALKQSIFKGFSVRALECIINTPFDFTRFIDCKKRRMLDACFGPRVSEKGGGLLGVGCALRLHDYQVDLPAKRGVYSCKFLGKGSLAIFGEKVVWPQGCPRIESGVGPFCGGAVFERGFRRGFDV